MAANSVGVKEMVSNILKFILVFTAKEPRAGNTPNVERTI